RLVRDGKIHKIQIPISKPRGSHPGRDAVGYYKLVDDVITMVDRNALPIIHDGNKYTAKVEPGDEVRRVAARLLRSTLSYREPADFNAPIVYPNLWGNRPASLWIAEDFGCCASG